MHRSLILTFVLYLSMSVVKLIYVKLAIWECSVCTEQMIWNKILWKWSERICTWRPEGLDVIFANLKTFVWGSINTSFWGRIFFSEHSHCIFYQEQKAEFKYPHLCVLKWNTMGLCQIRTFCMNGVSWYLKVWMEKELTENSGLERRKGCVGKVKFSKDWDTWVVKSCSNSKN